VSRWQRFWFPDGGQYASAFVRIGIALSVLLTLHKIGISDYQADLARRSAALYDPDGILMVLGRDMPSAGLLGALRIVAYLSTCMLLVGAATRTANVVSLVSALALATFQVSFTAGWPHHLNLAFLAQLAFLFARGGDVLSVDALVRRWRGLEPVPPALGYQWSVRLVVFAVAFMYFDAFAHKIVMAGGTLRWAFSDNLRNHLLVRFDWIGLARPALADWLVQSPWRYQTAAFLNLVAQCAPMIGFFLFRRPWLRAFLGLFFVIETVALAAVMDLWNLHWLPLYAAFVDWDRILSQFGLKAASATAPTPSARDLSSRLGRVWLMTFVVVMVVVGSVPKLDTTLRTFPFSRFPMFGQVRAKKPYGVSQSYEFLGNRIELEGIEISPKLRRWLDGAYPYRWLQRLRDPKQLARKLDALAKALARRRDARGASAIRVHLAIFQALPRPAPARLEVHRVGILGERLADGRFRAVKGSLSRKDGAIRVTAEPIGFADPPTITGFAVIVDDQPSPELFGLEPAEGGYRLPDPGGQSVLVLANVEVDGTSRRYVVARDPPVAW